MMFGQVITAMATPMAADGSVDLNRSGELAVRLVETGSDGLVVAGSTGESATLTVSERLELFASVVDAVGGKACVIGNTGTNDTSESIQLTKRAASTGIDAVMAVTPYYNKPPQAGLVEHFKSVAAASDLPVMMYNVPGRTGVNMSADAVLELSLCDGCVAVKEASGDLQQIATICAGAPAGFFVYSGDDALTLPIMSVGGTGVVSVAAHLVGREIKQMIEAYKRGEIGRAQDIHAKLLPVFSMLFITANPIPLKRALALSGFDVGIPRLPLVEATGEQSQRISEVLKTL